MIPLHANHDPSLLAQIQEYISVMGTVIFIDHPWAIALAVGAVAFCLHVLVTQIKNKQSEYINRKPLIVMLIATLWPANLIIALTATTPLENIWTLTIPPATAGVVGLGIGYLLVRWAQNEAETTTQSVHHID